MTDMTDGGENVGTPPVSVSKYPNLKPFRKGQSGNPGGKPRGRTYGSVARELLDKDGNLEALVEAHYRQAMKGDAASAKFLIEHAYGKVPAHLEINKSAASIVRLDWSRTPELQQPIDVEARAIEDDTDSDD